MAENVQQLLRERLEDDGTAVVSGDRSWTWREHLAEASAEAAAVLAGVDRERPVHVGTLLGNSPSMLRAMAADAMPQTKIAPGERDVTVNVSVRFLLG